MLIIPLAQVMTGISYLIANNRVVRVDPQIMIGRLVGGASSCGRDIINKNPRRSSH